jgi:hypothetical protein
MRINEPDEIQKRMTVLKNCIEKEFGRKITGSHDCNELSDEIFRKTDKALNANTLRRFFGLVTYNFQPSKTTLNVLANYCGYSSFHKVPETLDIEENNAVSNESVLEFLKSLYRIEVKEKNDLVYFSIVKETVNLLNRNAHLRNDFHRYIAKTKNGRTYYFEKFTNLDGLNSFYGEGFREYLLERNDIADKIFGHSLQAMRYWLSMDDANMKQHYFQLRNHKPGPGVKGNAAAMFYASHLFYNIAQNSPAEPVLEEAKNFHCRMQPEHGYWLASSFELIFLKALAFSGLYQESIYYIQCAREKVHQYSPFNDFDRNTLQLYEAFVLFHLLEYEKAKTALRGINPENFNFLSKKLDTTVYLILKSKLENAPTRYLLQIQSLIAETGYDRLGIYLHENANLNKKEQKCGALIP